jgi:hypothetical protein
MNWSDIEAVVWQDRKKPESEPPDRENPLTKAFISENGISDSVKHLAKVKCMHCNGTGTCREFYCDACGHGNAKVCKNCKGTGYVQDDP